MTHREYPKYPLIGVGAVVLVDDNKVLLVKRAHPPGKGKWSIPGGLVKVGESLVDAVLRELSEETGISGRIIGLIDLFEYIEIDDQGKVRYHYVIVDFLVKPLSMNLKPSSDVTDARFYEIDYAINNLKLTKTTKKLLRKIQKREVKVIDYLGILEDTS